MSAYIAKSGYIPHWKWRLTVAAGHIGPAVAVTPYEVASLGEEEATTLFRHYRFLKTGGEPFCPQCGSLAINEFRCRPIFKCKDCEHRFTLTSGTAFAYRKLSFKRILSILAEFNIAYQGRSAREIRRNIRSIKNYKTVFVWVHKIRAALKQAQAATVLEGEVEVDGAETGGYIKPKNTAKERSDFRKVPYRAKDRKMFVTLARQRNGPTRAWVARQEHHPIPQLMNALQPDTVVFADKGKWGAIREKFSLFQVPHRWTFHTPEACTNFAESGFRVFRGLEMIFRHVAGTYLDLYAAQLAWQLDRVRMDDDEGFASILSAMVAPGRSEMAGYFLPKKEGGRKRLCQIVEPDGSDGTWAPPSAEERRRRRRTREQQPAELAPTLRMARSDRWNEGFSFAFAGDVVSGKVVLPAEPGVYAVFIAEGDRLLARSGYFPDPAKQAWEYQAHHHVYTGETYSLRTRMSDHLSEDIGVSNLRETLLALQWCVGALPGMPTLSKDREQTEQTLSLWLQDRALVAYKVCGYVREVERQMLERTASPLNIRDRAATPYAQLLRNLRARFQEEVVRTWPAPTRPLRKPQRR